MAKYKDIGGSAVQFRSGAEEYTYPSPEGELFYNSSNGQFQFVGLGTGAWSTGGVRNNASGALGGSIIGTQTSAVAAGGNISGTLQSNAETYNVKLLKNSSIN